MLKRSNTNVFAPKILNRPKSKHSRTLLLEDQVVINDMEAIKLLHVIVTGHKLLSNNGDRNNRCIEGGIHQENHDSTLGRYTSINLLHSTVEVLV